MHYSSNCGCGCNYDCGCNTVPSTCSSTTNNIVTTTTHCVGEPCDELYNADCVLYKGPNIPCYGLNVNDTLTDIIDSILINFEGCITKNVCFKITHTNGTVTESCSSIPSTDLWNDKQYYKIKINSCSNLIGYVYWNSTDKQWEFSNKLGGGNFINSTLPILSASPLSSTQWINASPAFGIISSISGICAPTTTTSTSTTTSTTTTIAPTTTIPPTTTTVVPTTTTTTIPPTTTTTTIPPTTTTTTNNTPTTTSTTTLGPVGFIASGSGNCNPVTAESDIFIFSFTGGSGVYEVSDTTFDSYAVANANTLFVNSSVKTYYQQPNGIRWIVIRDTNNPTNKLVKSVTNQCCTKDAKAIVPINQTASFEYYKCDGTRVTINSFTNGSILFDCIRKGSIKILNGSATIVYTNTNC